MKRKELICLIISLIVFISLIIIVKTKGFLEIERDLFNFLSSISFIKCFMFFITTFGEWYSLIIIVISLFSILKKKISIIISINLLCSYLLNFICKMIVARPRPEWHLINENGYSFPSGHTTVSMCFYGFLIYLIINYYHGKYKKTLISVLSILIVLIGLSRITLGVHYLTDVLASFTFGIIYLIIFITIVKRKNYV